MVVLIYPLGLSLSPHKEFRFLLPVLPLAFVLAGAAFVTDMLPPLPFPTISSSCSPSSLLTKESRRRKTERCRIFPVVLFLVLTNASVAFYFSRVHQRGPIDVMSFLSDRLQADVQQQQQQQQEQQQQQQQKEHPLHHQQQHGDEDEEAMEGGAREREDNDVRIDFLMPCHSTPWTTHLHVPAFFSSSLSSLPPSLPPRRLLLHHLDCSPNLHGHALHQTTTDGFLLDPQGYASQRYGEKSSSSSNSNSGSSNSSSDRLEGTSSSLLPSLLPDYIVSFGSAAWAMEWFLVSLGFHVEATLFHSSFKGDADSPRSEESIVLFSLDRGRGSAGHRHPSFIEAKEEL